MTASTRTHLPNICILSSALNDLQASNQNVGYLLARRLKDYGFNVYKGFKSTEPYSANNDNDTKLRYVDYLTTEPVSIDMPDVYVVMPNDISLLSALFKVLSTIENKAGGNALIILTPKSYWQGLLAWFNQDTLLHNELINKQTLERISTLDDLDDIVDLIIRFSQE